MIKDISRMQETLIDVCFNLCEFMIRIYVHVIFGTTDVCNECADILAEKIDGGKELISMC